MAQIELAVALLSRLRGLAVWVQIDALEVTRTSQLLQTFFMFLAINALLCQDALTVSLIARTLLCLASLLALLF